ncbi:cytochrome bc1 complex Rieske iron-sulfur subunit [Cellulomonas composti]|uniref:Cytochrome bc1 complex Rieske iron-sulfur subunit n=1 Tax=Cellulomonas composti TaxID=266130 RepID=A0A511J739_9CELL|nr:Rieske 2Fe-2S domain-containing protein [Cellulomonas composti]GEL93815.1 ubiquinol-cytochrome c reductase [Cellulomonas composti]
MSTHDPHSDVVVHGEGELPDRFDDPGLHEHKPRQADVDPKVAKRVERQVLFLFTLSILGTIGVVWAYFALPPGETPDSMRTSNVVLGVCLALSLLGIGIGGNHYIKVLMSNREYVEERHEQRSSDETREIAVQMLKDGAQDSGLSRRGALVGAGLTALALFPLAIVVPLIGNVGEDWNVRKFKHTMWKKGTRLATDPQGRPIKASDVTIGDVWHVIPDGLNELEHGKLDEKAKAIVLLVRLDPRDLKSDQSPAGETWGYDGIVAYSKVCTHVGCPVALYEQQTHHLLCPCHQSTFDVADACKVVFGPAKRPLPQLPITVDDEGYLVAQSDFHEPVGPSFWERATK